MFSGASGGPLGTRAAASARASFYPNPVAGALTVAGGAAAGTLRLRDAAGRAVLAQAYRRGQPVDLSAVAPGRYWLQLDQEPPLPLLKR
ncbi:T9SS type A sorting domain-containing protein (plasmid) [Hymenobacter sp. 5317J-9]|uniref:T9SS type A sorting domain-containing protein n=1 Tax=Hymenobacter sp. 5317J-9 TaxID=2932250 RepID=UPI001FD6D3C5|nr:T9SS type A sorting domain-containing protein [Hymenobacter sp. 5317J-9]UOR00230.1 T9SS type A sorting domain-containing protein [Hymenobacter sp. 5317J-9]